jgi:hypothetical protein
VLALDEGCVDVDQLAVGGEGVHCCCGLCCCGVYGMQWVSVDFLEDWFSRDLVALFQWLVFVVDVQVVAGGRLAV